MTHPLDTLLCPKSVAIVGASDRPDSNGKAMVDMSRIDGYGGAVYPVNPRLSRIGDLPCYPSLRALPEVPDHVVIGVASPLVEDVLDQAIGLGVRSATIFASCYVEGDTPPKLPARIAAKTRAAGMALCGANCMGFYTPHIGLRVASMPSPSGLRQGGIAWIVQSGSALGALAHNDRRLGFALAVSTGMELGTTAADYMDWALSQPHTRVVGLFLETVRDPGPFVAALKRARAQRVPVVALKVGRTERSAQMAVSHTGAIAGNDMAFDALCQQHGVTRVDDLDEMAATLALFDTDRALGPGGFGAIHDSGGERELAVDLATDIGLTFPRLDPATAQKMRAHLDFGLVAENPLDAYGTSRNVEHRFEALTSALMQDPQIALGFFIANPRDGYTYAEKYANALRRAAYQTGKPVALVSTYSMATDTQIAGSLARAGVPLLRGMRNALRAAKHVLDHRDFHARTIAPAPKVPPPPARWTKALKAKGQLSEWEGLSLLAEGGIATPGWVRIGSAQDLDGLQDLAFPCVLKTAENHAHKSDVGGVALGLADAPSLHAAYRKMAQSLGPRALVMEMVPRGTELALGAVWDDSFGPVVVVSAGGVLIELFDDKAAALAPFSEAQALRMIEGLRIFRVLQGARGQVPVDLAALAQAVSRFSVLVASLGPAAAEIDVNPLICSAHGAVAVDCLVVGPKG